MCVANSEELNEKRQRLIDFLKNNEISYELVKCCGCDRLCINFNSQKTTDRKYCCNTEIIVSTTDKDSYKIKPNDIIFITIDKRRTILFLKNCKLETNYSLSYWRNILNMNRFAQPHSSYIVNLDYVTEIKKGTVKLIDGDIDYIIYSSQRKISAFKKALLNYYNSRDKKCKLD